MSVAPGSFGDELGDLPDRLGELVRHSSVQLRDRERQLHALAHVGQLRFGEPLEHLSHSPAKSRDRAEPGYHHVSDVNDKGGVSP